MADSVGEHERDGRVSRGAVHEVLGK